MAARPHLFSYAEAAASILAILVLMVAVEQVSGALRRRFGSGE